MRTSNLVKSKINFLIYNSEKCINKCDLFSAILRSNAFIKNAMVFL